MPTVQDDDLRAYDMALLPYGMAQKIVISDAGCWEWTGGKDPHGYGRVCADGGYYLTHRVSVETYHGPIVKGMHTDHLCRNTSCCNPAHLERVTPRENVLRSPIAVAALNARKTHCKRGHEFTAENTTLMSGGKRKCRTCHAEFMRRKRLDLGMEPRTRLENRTECRNGHPTTSESVMVNSQGRTICRTCRTESNRRTKAARKAAQA